MEELKKVNLPKTDFSMKANLAQKEPIQQSVWEKNNLYQKMLDKNKSNKKYILHDGPPYANGHIHLGHALNKVLKDIIIKYESMKGNYSPYIPGWDCHGLPIEYQMLKEMNTDKNKVDQFIFRKKAAKYALKFVDIQKEEFKRLGIFGDWDNPYLTLNPKYEATIIKIFKELFLAGYIYRGMKPVLWCSSCETALAEAEVEYENHVTDSIFVKFKSKKDLAGFKDISVIIWTTTPWTLPANVAVAFNPEYEYVIFEVKNTTNKNIKINEKFVIAKELLDKVSKKISVTEYAILKTLKGKDLENIVVSSPFRTEDSIGVLADYVTLEDGSGIVHIAPGHGEEDYLVGLKYKLPVLTPVNDKGQFTDEVKEYKGMHVFDSNPLIIKNLDDRNLLLCVEKLEHSYPHCWRCKKPIVFRATSQWFLDIDKNGLRQKLIDSCKDVKWIPDYGFNRITSMIENRPHWCLSRQRLWGTPIPVFYCQDCGEVLMTEESITAVEKLVEKEGSDFWFTKDVKEILPENIKCKCGSKNFKKETDILDVWFDSGVSHEVVLKQREGLAWPADLYLEGSDQHRGWFQTSLIPSVALYSKAPYKNVLTHGFTVDGTGKKMSKSLGNVIAPQDIIKKYGADILRLWIASENYKDDMRISDDIILQLVDAYRKIRNTARYLLGNIFDYDHLKDEIAYKDLLEIDKWALLVLSETSREIDNFYKNREFHNVYRKFYNFCTVELSSLYFDILKDRLYVSSPKSLDRRSAQTVLYYLVSFISRMLAPVMPFTSEEIWKYIPGNKDDESILLNEFPGKLEEKNLELWSKDTKLKNKWNEIFELRKVILKKLEEVRLKGVIGNSLEAKVKIYLEKEIPEYELKNNNEIFWQTVFIVSQVNLVFGDIKECDMINDNDLPLFLKSKKVKIEVEKASGQKCSRCWNWSEKITSGEGFTDLCPRCVEIVKKW
jgi:isoleucyl-tRNA synthetase